jgi:cellulose synthase/poly-beta-1,6-N-acetylglucosamine synthase-like glycosyltransferase
MAMAVLILKIYIGFVVFVMAVYFTRHFIFSMNRIYGEQRFYYQDIFDSDLPFLSVLIPMHNEEKVASHILDALTNADYPKDRIELIPIDDHSSDGTWRILDEYAARYPFIKPLHRTTGDRGKQNALNDAIRVTAGEIILVFDADYLPPRCVLKDLAVCFNDPEVGAAMGRVVPVNTSQNLLTRILDLERSGGYQVDQQARHNLRLVAQYGGTVGGFRKKLLHACGGFDPKIITEDTELTFKLYVNGWKVAYANRVECYEEVPENWVTRSRQIRRWARGHTQVMFRYFIPVIRSKFLSAREKIDGILLLSVYAVPAILFLGIADSVALFFIGEINLLTGILPIILTVTCNTFGNFAPFYQIGIASFLDGSRQRILLLPFLVFNFLFSLWYTTQGFLDAVFDIISTRRVIWHKTKRFRRSTT